MAINGKALDRASLVRVARGAQPVFLSDDARTKMTWSREIVENSLQKGDAVYGLSTGLGVLKKISIADQAAAFSRSVLRTHKCGQVFRIVLFKHFGKIIFFFLILIFAKGPTVPADLVRGTILRLLNAYAEGSTGVRPLLADRLIIALNTREIPSIRSLGSIGQADLAPMVSLKMKQPLPHV